MVASYTGTSTGQETQIIWDGVKNIFKNYLSEIQNFSSRWLTYKNDDPLKWLL